MSRPLEAFVDLKMPRPMTLREQFAGQHTGHWIEALARYADTNQLKPKQLCRKAAELGRYTADALIAELAKDKDGGE